MAVTATVVHDDDPTASTKRFVVIEFDSNGTVFRTRTRPLPAGVFAQEWADGVKDRYFENVRRAEAEKAVARAILGVSPATIPLRFVSRAALRKLITRRLYNAPKKQLPVEEMIGLAQWVFNRPSSEIASDLGNVRTEAEIDALKAQWTSMLTKPQEYTPVDEEV